jgi:AcrR family transcriptional regulator
MGKHQPSDVRRAQIIQAAVEVCADKGYHASRIDDIAARAGLSKGAVYHHFASKQEVFIAVMEMMLVEATRFMDDLDESGTSAIEAMRRTIDLLLDMFEHPPTLLRGVFELFFLSSREPEFRERVLGYYDRLIEVTERLIRHGMERGELAPDLDPKETARVFLMGGDGLLAMLLMLNREEQAARSVRLMSELMFRGMASQPQEGGE